MANNSVIKSDAISIAKAIAAINEGKRPVSIPLSDKPDTISDVNALGYALLKQALESMTWYEIRFAATMCGCGPNLSPKQRAFLKATAIKYLQIDIDGESIAESGLQGLVMQGKA